MRGRSLRFSLAVLVMAGLLHGCSASDAPDVRPTAAEPTMIKSRLEAAAIVRRPPTAKDKYLQKRYDRSIKKSAIFHQSNQVDDLRAVTGPARMLSFISCFQCEPCAQCQAADADCEAVCRGCSAACLEPGSHRAPVDVWVSFADEIYDACKEFDPFKVVLRMQQLQGLPPIESLPTSTWKMLVVDVEGPEQLFRPCADPDPTTTGPCGESFPPEADEAYRAWIAGQAFGSWQIPFGYPWTRLGYTYNWDPRSDTTVGTSEFVIPEGTTIEVVELVDAIAFCMRPDETASEAN